MFTNKQFNLSGFLSRSKTQSRKSSVVELRQRQSDAMQQEIQKLKNQNKDLKQQLQKLKEMFIEARINHDNQIRAYDQLLQQIRIQLSQKQSLIQKYLNTLKGQDHINCDEIQDQENQNLQKNERLPQLQGENPDYNKNEICELMLHSSIRFKHKYESSLQQIEVLKNQCEKLKHQISNPCQKANTPNTNDISFTGKGQSKISFDFGDITTDLKDVNEIAQFSNGPTQITVDEQQIHVRDERIQNLERQNLELQHQLASRSHKIATIFNSAFQFGGMHLLDYLQNSIGLIEAKK